MIHVEILKQDILKQDIDTRPCEDAVERDGHKATKRMTKRQKNLKLKQELEELGRVDIDVDTLFDSYLGGDQVKRILKTYTYFEALFQRFDIYTTRFTSETYEENRAYKQNKLDGFKGSLYSTTLPFPVNASLSKYFFVLDMNNTTNKLMGIGFVKNILAKEQNIRVHRRQGFNLNIFKSDFYISLDSLDSLDSVDKGGRSLWKTFLAKEFESYLFYGKSNMKRGGAFTRFPLKKMEYKHLKFLLMLFVAINPAGFNRIVSL